MVESGTLPPELIETARHVLAAKGNILAAGSTSSGKMTLFSALLNDLEAGERYLVIEDAAEVQLEQPHKVRFTARKAAPGRPAVTIRDLVRAALRHRPDGLVVGEARGGEAWDLTQALNTGHAAFLPTKWTLHLGGPGRLRRCERPGACGTDSWGWHRGGSPPLVLRALDLAEQARMPNSKRWGMGRTIPRCERQHARTQFSDPWWGLCVPAGQLRSAARGHRRGRTTVPDPRKPERPDPLSSGHSREWSPR